MSGPKLMELRRLRRAAIRKHNLERMAEFYARYERLLKEVLELKNKLAALNIAVPQEFASLEQLVRKYTPELDNQHDVEVVREFESKVQSLQEFAEGLRLRREEKLAEIENIRTQDQRDLENKKSESPAVQTNLPDRLAKKTRTIAEFLKKPPGAKIQQAKEEWERLDQINALIDSAAAFSSPAVRSIVNNLRAQSSSVRDLESWKEKLAEAIASEQAAREREEKRLALLESLRDLGYETNEQLQTALVQGGRLVFSSPHKSEYGLEIIANRDLSQVQSALVRFSAEISLSEEQRRRDIEREEQWCGDHARLRQKLAERGFEMHLRAQQKPGEHPVKIIADETGKRRETTASKLKMQ